MYPNTRFTQGVRGKGRVKDSGKGKGNKESKGVDKDKEDMKGSDSRKGTGSATGAKKSERGRQSTENCVHWFCEQLDRTSRSIMSSPSGNILVCVWLLYIHLICMIKVGTGIEAGISRLVSLMVGLCPQSSREYSTRYMRERVCVC